MYQYNFVHCVFVLGQYMSVSLITCKIVRAVEVNDYCKTLIICAHLIFAKFANSLKSRH